MADEKTTAITKAQADSIQVHPDATKGENVSRLEWIRSRGPLLPEFGSRRRERMLNFIYLADYNWIVKSAFAGLMKKVAATPWEITGPDDISTGAKAWYYKQVGSLESERPDIEYWQEILRQANFGSGWSDFIKMGIDYLKQDAGWYWEIIAPGNPNQPPTGAVTGIAHLDSLRAFPTGDPTYPVLYLNEKNEYHLMHHTRVVHMVDMPSGDVTKRGYGMCALSRAVVIATREVNMAKYIDANLDDKPPPGVVVASGMTKQERNRAMREFNAEQSTDEQPMWGKQLWFYGADATQPAALQFNNFSQAPEKFDFEQYTNIDVNSLALAIGVDVQELWQLTGGNIGSATQSEVLHRKGQGRAIGDIYINIERAMNDILPLDYVFEFKYKDEQEDKQQAELARIWTDSVTVAGDNLSPDEARRVLANQVPAYHDAITDESGQIVRADDLDRQSEIEGTPDTETEVVDEAIATPQTETVDGVTTPNVEAPPQIFAYHIEQGIVTRNEVRATLGLPALPEPEGNKLLEIKEQLNVVQQAVTAGIPLEKAIQIAGLEEICTLPELECGDDNAREEPEEAGEIPPQFKSKEYSATREQFIERVGDMIGTFVLDQNRQRFGIAMRRFLRQSGQRAFIDGLGDGGVIQTSLNPEEKQQLASWVARQSPFITQLGKEVKGGLVIENTTARATMWANKSLEDMYQAGLLSADANGMYEWALGATEEHCKTCLRLDGQRHRLKDWKRKNLMPKSSKLDCGGWQCDCILSSSTGRAKGRF